MAKTLFVDGNYVIADNNGTIGEYAINHCVYTEENDTFIVKERIDNGTLKIATADAGTWVDGEATPYTEETMRSFFRENTGFKSAPGGSGAEPAKELNLIYDAPNFLMTEVWNTLGVTRVGFSTSSAGAGLGIVDFFWTNELDVSKMIIHITSEIPTIGTPPFNFYGVTTKTATGFQIKIFDGQGVLAATGVYNITLKYFG